MTSPVSERGYARPELLADTEWLANHLSDPRLRIVDARSKDEYGAGHIPGAVHMDGFGHIPRTENGDMGDAADFAAMVGGMGIATEDTVVVYDSPSQRMGMIAWAFLYYGHVDVRILDGGMAKWLAEGRPLDDKTTALSAATYVAMPQAAVYCSLEDAKSALGRDDFVFWDTRSHDEYTGKEAGFRAPPRPGRIPRAAHLEWTELLDPQSRTLKPAGELREMLAAKGITPDKQVAGYCNGGARGALAGYVLQVLGYERGQAYAGSFGQWSRQPDTEVEV